MIGKLLKLSITTIWHSKMRSLLTMLGIIIGVVAVIVLVSLTQGATAGVTDRIARMGSDQITAVITDTDATVTLESVEGLTRYPAIESVAPVISTNQTVKKGRTSKSYSIVGITPSYFSARNIEIQSGRMIMDSDLEWYTNVAIIGTDVAGDLFDSWDAVDGTIMIGDKIYKVIGVVARQSDSFIGSDNNRIMIPYTTAERMTGQKSVSSFYIKAADSTMVDSAINTTKAFLLRQTRDEDSYTVNNQANILEAMADVTNTLSLLLAGIAAISLIVGGIGIMNIMLVSVSERTREIGIRKAVGAKRSHILFQFLCESCVLSIVGGCLGLLLSYLAITIFNIVTSATIPMNWTVGFMAVGFCMIIGIIFGSYPAAKASRLQPIEALRML